jgi:hypothetical protein
VTLPKIILLTDLQKKQQKLKIWLLKIHILSLTFAFQLENLSALNDRDGGKLLKLAGIFMDLMPKCNPQQLTLIASAT